MKNNDSFDLTKKSKKILSFLAQNPGVKNKEIQNKFNMSAPATSNFMKKLLDNNFVYCKIQGRNSFWFVKDSFLVENSVWLFNEESTEDQKNNFNYDLLFFLIKGSLVSSNSPHAKVLLEDYEFFLHFFTKEEFVMLCYFLKIFNNIDNVEFTDLFKVNKKYENDNKKNLITRYKDILYYIFSKNNETDFSRN